MKRHFRLLPAIACMVTVGALASCGVDSGVSWAVSSDLGSQTGVSYTYNYTTTSGGTISSVEIALPLTTPTAGVTPTVSSVSGLGSGTVSLGQGTSSVGEMLAISCPATNACLSSGFGGLSYLGTSLTSSPSWTEYSNTADGLTSLTNSGGAVDGISCPSTSICYAVGFKWSSGGSLEGFIAETNSNGSGAWTEQLLTANTILYSISCSSTTTCEVVGANGNIYGTTNGSTWASQTSGTTNFLYGVSCWSSTSCVATGASGTTLYTSNGGSTWSTAPSVTTNDLERTSCSSTGVCLAPGLNGTILLSSNAGQTWATETSGTTNSLYAVSWLPGSSTTAFIGGVGGTLLTTTTGGSSWSTVASSTTGTITDIACPLNCFAADDTGQIITNVSGSWSSSPGSVVPTLTYTITSPVSISSGAAISLTFGGMTNPPVGLYPSFIVDEVSSGIANGDWALTNPVSFVMTTNSVVASQSITAGTLSFVSSPANVTFSSITLNGFNQTSTASQLLDIGDNTGSGSGWHVTLSNTLFTSGANQLASSDFTVPSSPSTTCDTGSTCSTANFGTWSTYVLPGATGTKLLSAAANSGLGNQTVSLGWQASIPSSALAGTYTSTWTVSLVSGP